MTSLMALTSRPFGVPSCGTSGVGLYGVACCTVQMPKYRPVTELKLRICLKQKEPVYGEVTCKYGTIQQSTN